MNTRRKYNYAASLAETLYRLDFNLSTMPDGRRRVTEYDTHRTVFKGTDEQVIAWVVAGAEVSP